MKKAAKGTLAVSTLGTSVAAEKAVKVLAARGADVTHEEEAAGAIFVGMSHESGRNSKVSLYADRIERVKERSRMSVSSARQDTEIKAVSSVQARKDGLMFTNVTVYATGNNIDFRFRHDDAQAFKDALAALILAPDASAPTISRDAPDVADQIKKFADLRDAGVLTEEEFQSKKVELLAKM